MNGERSSESERRTGRLQRYAKFLFKRVSGLYYRDVLRNQQEILRRQEELAQRIEGLTPPRPAVYLGDHKVLTRTAYGHSIVLDSRDQSLFPHITLGGVWESWVTKVMRDTLSPGMTVVDVGANVGYFTLLACGSVGQEGRVYAFEPDPETYRMLFRSVEMNGFRPFCECYQLALSSVRGSATFYRFSAHFGGNSLWHQGGSTTEFGDEVSEVQIQTVPFDDFAEQAGIAGRRIDVIKIDTEGSEAHVLQGMRKTLAANPDITLICEFNAQHIRTSGCDPDAGIDSLLESGFKLRIIGYDGSICPISREELLVHNDAVLYLTRS